MTKRTITDEARSRDVVDEEKKGKATVFYANAIGCPPIELDIVLRKHVSTFAHENVLSLGCVPFSIHVEQGFFSLLFVPDDETAEQIAKNFKGFLDEQDASQIV